MRTGCLQVAVLIVAGVLTPGLDGHADAEATKTFASKVTVRTHGGLLSNAGTIGGSALTLGGLTFGYQAFFSQRWALSFEYQTDFDYKRGVIPLKSVIVSGRYYFRGQGTRVSAVEVGQRWSKTPASGFYLSPQIAFSEYFLGTNSETTPGVELTGSFLTVGASVGADFRLSELLQLTFEVRASPLSFAGSDDRFRVSGYMLGAGISYLW